MPAPSLEQELEQLVLEQVRTFKLSANMNDSEMLEYHLRHYRIMMLYHEMDRIEKSKNARRKGWLS
jgi:hypothetical protein